jgi:hypothetical protein
MAIIRELTIQLTEWESKILLELLAKEGTRLRRISGNSTDEDEQADAGNEFMEVDGLRERFEQEAKSVFGAEIKNLKRDLV